jgi:hypothetical protein
MKRATLIATLLWASAAASCRQNAPPPATAPAPSPPGPPQPTAHEVADRMDPRTPVPLLPMMAQHQKENMRGHLVAVQEIVAALAQNDFTAAAEAVSKIGYSEPMARMCNHMGAGAPGFTPAAIEFHRTADTIAEAARRKDRVAAFAALHTTLGACVGCHARYKQQIVDEAAWSLLTAQAPPTGGAMHHP